MFFETDNIKNDAKGIDFNIIVKNYSMAPDYFNGIGLL